MSIAPAWRSRIVGQGEEAPSSIVPNDRNWRSHPKAQQQAMAGVLDQVGWVSSILVNRRTGRLVDGHLRVELALARGEATVPVRYVDLEPDEEAWRAALPMPAGGSSPSSTSVRSRSSLSRRARSSRATASSPSGPTGATNDETPADGRGPSDLGGVWAGPSAVADVPTHVSPMSRLMTMVGARGLAPPPPTFRSSGSSAAAWTPPRMR